MDELEFLKSEYEVLYSEIRSNSQIAATLFTVSTTATASLIGYGLTLDNGACGGNPWAIYLSPFVILIPALVFIASQMEATVRNAAYIAQVIEKKISCISWETDWFRYRQERDIQACHTMEKYCCAISGLYGLMGILCILLAWFHVTHWSIWKVLFLGNLSVLLLLLLLSSAYRVHRAFNMDNVRRANENWRRLSAGEAKQSA